MNEGGGEERRAERRNLDAGGEERRNLDGGGAGGVPSPLITLPAILSSTCATVQLCAPLQCYASRRHTACGVQTAAGGSLSHRGRVLRHQGRGGVDARHLVPPRHQPQRGRLAIGLRGRGRWCWCCEHWCCGHWCCRHWRCKHWCCGHWCCQALALPGMVVQYSRSGDDLL